MILPWSLKAFYSKTRGPAIYRLCTWGKGMRTSTYLVVVISILVSWQHGVKGHGRLIEPPSRSSMWRYGFNTTANYNDHELYCGGLSRQYKQNKGLCGICGDPWDVPSPRPNEAGGVYGQGIIVRKYRSNSIIRIKVELTANHKGAFEFRLCPHNNPKKVVSQKCLDRYLLEQANNEGPRYYPGEGSKVFEARYLLPRDLTCTQCVMQWRYVAANNWGTCTNGSQAIGCGEQEEFRACSDVSILDNAGKASSDEDSSEDNVVDTDTFKVTTTTEKSGESLGEPVVWPFIMALVALMVAALIFGSLLGWFYRKEVISCLIPCPWSTKFARETIGKPSWKLSDLSPHHNRPPIPPPRNKNKINADLHHIVPPRRQLTPDVISQPMQVTINGLAV